MGWGAEEMGRDVLLNVEPKVLKQFRAALADGARIATEVGSLEELLCPDGSSLPQADHLEPSLQMQGMHLELADLDDQEHRCTICGRSFSDIWLLRQHEIDHGHFSSDDPEEIRWGKERYELAKQQALRKLQVELD